jgi:hypothetical protein
MGHPSEEVKEGRHRARNDADAWPRPGASRIGGWASEGEVILLFPVHQVQELIHLGHRQALVQSDKRRQVAQLMQHRRAEDRLRKAVAAAVAAGLDVERMAAELLEFNPNSIHVN